MKNMNAVILVGGKSRRMGSNKAFLKIGEKTFLEQQIELLGNVFDEIMISANSVDEYKGYGLPVIQDIYPEKGPLGGIYTALVNSKTDYSFVTACDMPFIEKGLISYLGSLTEGYDVVVPLNGEMLEPLHAFYSKNCIGPIKRELDENNLKVTKFFSQVNVKKVSIGEFMESNERKNPLTNLNTVNEYNEMKSI